MKNEDKLKSLLEYMEKEHGVTPENIDDKLKEMRNKLCEAGYRRDK